jgi:hypothetical protein
VGKDDRLPAARAARVGARAAATALVALAIGAAIVPLSPRVVEHVYSSRAYPLMQRTLTSASNRVPFALLDVLIVLLVCAWLALAVRDVRRAASSTNPHDDDSRQQSANGDRLAPHLGRAVVTIVVRTTVWAAAIYVAFVIVWGLNYRRTRLSDRVEFRADRITAAAARSIATIVVREVNAGYKPAHDAGWA